MVVSHFLLGLRAFFAFNSIHTLSGAVPQPRVACTRFLMAMFFYSHFGLGLGRQDLFLFLFWQGHISRRHPRGPRFCVFGRPTSSDNYGEPSCFRILFPTLVLDFSQDGYTPLLRYYFHLSISTHRFSDSN
ncbi:hypothetical protein B0J18DRAFT_260499 [Chaetomium sp. MPI-SDFR-AT-0129]|nr:hypothetical protein B0J18DRAFT_260499 [Chaetomium sp. MPI-SDFR-AT-0129]